MQKEITLRVLPSEAANEQSVKSLLAHTLSIAPHDITGFTPIRQSIDARGKQAWINLTVQVYWGEPYQPRPAFPFHFQDVHKASKQVIIIGAGPAGLFAALKLLEAGIRPIILERGKDVRARRRDLAAMNKEGIVNPESNYCFGEGGAGTYSDGKLYTRSSKRGDIFRILSLFVHFGAEEKILYQSHPHIGTNKLPHIITAMRQQILDCGGQIHFEHKVVDLQVENGSIKRVSTANGQQWTGQAVILATGHSARDIFELLHRHGLQLEAKPFALGVRVEHPQAVIDSAQYHCTVRDPFLPPASYSLVQQVDGKGVFSFCMCPGGIIAPAATSPGELVVNGWSPSKRNNAFANSGMVVTVDPADAYRFLQSRKNTETPKANDPLLLMKFQRAVEQAAFDAGGGQLVAPAQRLVDFTRKQSSSTLPGCSYLPGIKSVALQQVLPSFVSRSLQDALEAFGKKMRGYYTNEAVLVATESRTSSPVRIPRNEQLQHPQVKGLFPCAEGAGYAGGIVSAAMDGEKIASLIAEMAGKI